MKNFSKLVAISLLAISLFTISNSASATTPPLTKNGKIVSSIAPMIEKVNPSVVNIRTQIKEPKTDNPFAESPQFRQQPHRQNPFGKIESLGSGVIVDAKKGYIITNAHVIHNAKSITVTLSDGRHLKAKLIGEDVPSDIAVIQIKAKDLHAIKMANSDNLQVGDFVAAIGNPFGLTHTVTSGIISGLQRDYPRIEGYQDFIQTDASINPGNSGGALVNMQGELVGINTAILAPAGGNIGIGFAIPSNMARAVMEQLIRYGKVERGALGIMVQNFTPELANAFGDPKVQGALISMVNLDSPADKAGVKKGDIIVKINNRPVKSAAQVGNIIGLIRTGTKIDLTVLRDGKELQLTPVIEPRAKLQQELAKAEPYLYGLTLKSFTATTPVHGNIEGVLVMQVQPDTPAWRAGLRPGDIIISANNQAVRNREDLVRAIKNGKNRLLINVIRGNYALYMVLKP